MSIRISLQFYGVLNNGYNDLILVCKSQINTFKPVLVYFGNPNGKYSLKGRNDKLAYDTYVGIAVTRNYFTIENRDGINTNFSMYNHTFKVIGDKILFHRYDDAVYEVLDWDKGPELNHMETTRAQELGNPTFEEYKN